MKKQYYLDCNDVTYYELKDEDVFYETLERLEAFVRFEDFGIWLTSKEIPDDDLKGFLGLFYRYEMDMTLLAVFLTPENKPWFFDDKNTFWHKRVFEKSLAPKVRAIR